MSGNRQQRKEPQKLGIPLDDRTERESMRVTGVVFDRDMQPAIHRDRSHIPKNPHGVLNMSLDRRGPDAIRHRSQNSADHRRSDRFRGAVAGAGLIFLILDAVGRPPPPPVVAPVGKGKAPIGYGKGKAPPPVVTKG